MNLILKYNQGNILKKVLVEGKTKVNTPFPEPIIGFNSKHERKRKLKSKTYKGDKLTSDNIEKFVNENLKV